MTPGQNSFQLHDIIYYTFWNNEMNTDKGTGKSSYIAFLSEIYTLLCS